MKKKGHKFHRTTLDHFKDGMGIRHVHESGDLQHDEKHPFGNLDELSERIDDSAMDAVIEQQLDVLSENNPYLAMYHLRHGALQRALGVNENTKIPETLLQKEKEDSVLVRNMKSFARTLVLFKSFPKNSEVVPTKSLMWQSYERYKECLPSDVEPNPRSDKLGIFRKSREVKAPNDSDASVPDYAQYGMRVECGFTCPVLGLHENDFVILKSKKVMIVGELTVEHIKPRSQGGLTEPANIRMISMLANSFKNSALVISDEDIRQRFKEAGYERYTINLEDGAVLRKYGIKTFSHPACGAIVGIG